MNSVVHCSQCKAASIPSPRVNLQAALALPPERCPPQLAAAAPEKLATVI
jgi:hypothetical protein